MDFFVPRGPLDYFKSCFIGEIILFVIFISEERSDFSCDIVSVIFMECVRPVVQTS